MTCHFVIGSYEYALVIAGYNRFLNRTVEEDYRNIFRFCLVDNVLRGVV